MTVCQIGASLHFRVCRSSSCSFTVWRKVMPGPSSTPTYRGTAASLQHTIFGLSKDWCASGLRVGCMYTHNPMLCKSLNNMGYFCGVSGLAQYILARALEDLSWVDMYLTENANRLGASYNILAGEPVLPHWPVL